MTLGLQTRYFAKMDSPIGELLLTATRRGLSGVFSREHRTAPATGAGWIREPERFVAAREQLDDYFEGRRKEFRLPLDLAGTPFQLLVWEALQRIPFGQTMTYGQLARDIGRPKAVRAVGAANGRNTVSIIVPCHRVIGSDGSLTGYAGGVDVKRALLDLEAGHSLREVSAKLAGARSRLLRSASPTATHPLVGASARKART
jgi:methylated-DNA-[protein]-cysteine S-methyltransferase